MATRRSAGILLYRETAAGVEVLLGHMGGPLWARRDARGWTVPKGEYDEEAEDPLAAARREFLEEIGVSPPDGELLELGTITQSGGKVVTAWAAAGDLDPAAITPGTFEMEWSRGSGRIQTFPELDRVAWFGIETASEKIIKAQCEFLDRLVQLLSR